jgi:lipopolysaccharide export system protein LptC
MVNGDGRTVVKTYFGAVIVVMLAGLGAWAQSTSFDQIESFRIPRYDNEGNKVSLMTGEHARQLENGEVEITGVHLELYEQGELSATLTSPTCTYNEKKGLAYSRSDVKMTRGNVVLTGKGFTYDQSRETFRIFSAVKVEIGDIGAYKNLAGEE